MAQHRPGTRLSNTADEPEAVDVDLVGHDAVPAVVRRRISERQRRLGHADDVGGGVAHHLPQQSSLEPAQRGVAAAVALAAQACDPHGHARCRCRGEHETAHEAHVRLHHVRPQVAQQVPQPHRKGHLGCEGAAADVGSGIAELRGEQTLVRSESHEGLLDAGSRDRATVSQRDGLHAAAVERPEDVHHPHGVLRHVILLSGNAAGMCDNHAEKRSSSNVFS